MVEAALPYAWSKLTYIMNGRGCFTLCMDEADFVGGGAVPYIYMERADVHYGW